MKTNKKTYAKEISSAKAFYFLSIWKYLFIEGSYMACFYSVP